MCLSSFGIINGLIGIFGDIMKLNAKVFLPSQDEYQEYDPQIHTYDKLLNGLEHYRQRSDSADSRDSQGSRDSLGIRDSILGHASVIPSLTADHTQAIILLNSNSVLAQY